MLLRRHSSHFAEGGRWSLEHFSRTLWTFDQALLNQPFAQKTNLSCRGSTFRSRPPPPPRPDRGDQTRKEYIYNRRRATNSPRIDFISPIDFFVKGESAIEQEVFHLFQKLKFLPRGTGVPRKELRAPSYEPGLCGGSENGGGDQQSYCGGAFFVDSGVKEVRVGVEAPLDPNLHWSHRRLREAPVVDRQVSISSRLPFIYFGQGGDLRPCLYLFCGGCDLSHVVVFFFELICLIITRLQFWR